VSRSRTILLALFCLAGLAGLLAGCGGDSETVTVVETAPPAETTPGDDDTTSAGDDAVGDVTEEDEPELDPEVETDPQLFDAFQTPSGNIACILSDEGARCDIAKRDWNAPRPASCPPQMDFGQGLTVSDEGDGPGTVVCAGDTTLDPSAPVLDYGESTSVGDFTCTSEEDGVTCRDDGDNRGFFISKQAYELF
jgi:hypothetical protein